MKRIRPFIQDKLHSGEKLQESRERVTGRVGVTPSLLTPRPRPFISGVVLGGSLIMFACFLVNECDATTATAASTAGHVQTATKYGGAAKNPRSGVATSYSYGWSFLLAVLAFLASEASAVLCFTAFLRRFDSEVRTPPSAAAG